MNSQVVVMDRAVHPCLKSFKSMVLMFLSPSLFVL